MKIFDRLLHLIYPNVCAFCGEVMGYNHLGMYICDSCMEKVNFCANEECCNICGTPLENTAYKRCVECYNKLKNKTPINYERIVSVCEYNENSEYGIICFKKGRHLSTVNTYAGLLFAMILNEFGSVNFDVVTAVPPRADRMKSIGFDQSHYLAKKTAQNMNVKYIHNILKRARSTVKQTTLNKRLRQENLMGAFKLNVPPVQVENKTILVIDDVTTTGATINECARALKENGAKAVYGATIATTIGYSNNNK